MQKVRIYEVGPRDGLQNEKFIIPAQKKIALINLLSEVGFERIEVTSFVSPKWVPQMADASEVLRAIKRRPATIYCALTPNIKGFEAALAAGVEEIAIFSAASESFCQKNINCSIDQSIERFKPIIAAAQSAGIAVRGYVSCVAGCPYEGYIAPEAVEKIALQLMELGCYQVSLGDTIGHGTPETIADMLKIVCRSVPAANLAGHFHDTNNRALDNVAVALDFGLRTFDSSVGGLGGCPYAPGAKGNLATRPLAEMLAANGWQTGLDLEKLAIAEAYLDQIVSSYGQAGQENQ
ncbi:Hydroxymethylglutaryl-CoA lyase [hydrothermal vent metagenome]|uniref:Hydroxymethylglutaryl-CoA lyase n=1 Tax=hydrothermal vent metagenome TaxID=652676 RepID=A0A3B0UKV5_9ZZZZ